MSDKHICYLFMEFHEVWRSNVQDRLKCSKGSPSDILVCVEYTLHIWTCYEYLFRDKLMWKVKTC